MIKYCEMIASANEMSKFLICFFFLVWCGMLNISNTVHLTMMDI